MKAYYNEHDQKAAAWLRQLINNGDITPGEVDERSIIDVKPDDLLGFDRCHFFAGIGTWDYCLNQAGWGDRPVWTASLPCQPFSAAGKGLGKDVERHLLPHFLELVRECKPHTIIGEQVEAAIRHGWLDDLQASMEAEGYAVGHCVLGAHSVGAPHIRQRLYWLADSNTIGREQQPNERSAELFGSAIQQAYQWKQSSYIRSTFSGMGDNTYHDGRSASKIERSDGKELQNCQARTYSTIEPKGTSTSSSLSWIYCRDNKYRPVKPGIQPLAHGITKGMVYSSDPGAPIDANDTQEARAIRLKGYGNAIQAQTAIAFISAYMAIKS